MNRLELISKILDIIFKSVGIVVGILTAAHLILTGF